MVTDPPYGVNYDSIMAVDGLGIMHSGSIATGEVNKRRSPPIGRPRTALFLWCRIA